MLRVGEDEVGKYQLCWVDVMGSVWVDVRGSCGSVCVGPCGIFCVGSCRMAGVGSWACEFMGEARELMGAGAEAFVSDWACKETIGDGPNRDMD
jgi:hypothetical protein